MCMCVCVCVMGQSPDTKNDAAIWEELWVDWGRQPGRTGREESHVARGQKHNIPMITLQEELWPGRPGHRAFQSQLPPLPPTMPWSPAGKPVNSTAQAWQICCGVWIQELILCKVRLIHTHGPEGSRTADALACLYKGEQCLFWSLAQDKRKIVKPPNFSSFLPETQYFSRWVKICICSSAFFKMTLLFLKSFTSEKRFRSKTALLSSHWKPRTQKCRVKSNLGTIWAVN